jgi:hypothetical protein
VDQANQQLSGLSSGVSKIQGITTAVAGIGIAAAGLSKATGFIGRATDAAAGFGEAVSKSGELFGAETPKILKFAEDASDNFAISKQSALDATSTFAIFGRSAGLAGDDLVKFSTDFTGLASDLSSFNDTSPEEAINAIGSALRGEAEPLRRYGVLLDDASLRQAALELGITKTTKEALTPQQKVLAAQKVIYEQTTTAQGDYARTQTSLSNLTKKAAADQANLNIETGQIFVPIMTELTKILILAVDIFSSLPGPIKTITVVLGLLVATVGPLIILVSALKTAMVTLGAAKLITAGSTGALTIATKLLSVAMKALPILMVIGFIILLVKNWDFVIEVVGKVWEAIKTFGEWLFPFISDLFGKVGSIIADTWNGIFNKTKEVVGNVINWLKDNWKLILAVLTGPFGLLVLFLTTFGDDLFKKFVDVGKNIVQGLWNGIQSMAAFIKDKVYTFFGNLIPSWAKSILGISSPSTVFKEIGQNIVAGLSQGLAVPRVIPAPRLAIPNAQTAIPPVNITINAGLGTDPVQLGRQVNSALQKYGRVSTRVNR